MKSICVYCGSSDNVPHEYIAAAYALGATLARRGLQVVFGGGRTGLMGALANGTLENGGQVHGVIVESMNTPALAHFGLTQLEVFSTMYQRKARLYELGDGFVALPGGYGTFDELFETLSGTQIGIHSKPVGIVNVNGYFDLLIAMLDQAEAQGFIFREHRQALLCAKEPNDLLDKMESYQSSEEAVDRWMRRN